MPTLRVGEIGSDRPAIAVAEPDLGFMSGEEIDLRRLISHNASVEAGAKIEDVWRFFEKSTIDFMAVLDEKKLIGMCSRHELGTLLSGRFGFSLWARDLIRDHLSKHEIRIVVGDPIGRVLATVFARSDEAFYDDVLLASETGDLIGLISTQTLFKVQNALLRGNILILERKEREIQTKNEQMETDLRMAMELQQALLPKEYPLVPSQPNETSVALRFAHLYQPASLVSGDFFHLVRISDHEAGVFICDVMGHGVRSALITAMLRALIGAEAANLNDPGLLLTHLNRELTAILKQTDTVLFVTALYCVFDCERMVMRHARAGHQPPLHVRRSVDQVQFTDNAEASGPALGLFPEATFGGNTTQLGPGDLILLFTDGIVEAENAAGDEWGMLRLKQTTYANLKVPGAELLDLLLANARSFTETKEFVDDVCLAAIELCLQSRV